MKKLTGVRIQDPLYGIIELDRVERGIIDSPSFQRLLSVKQLGFAYAAFPGADYSRFTHSIGANHVVQKLLRSLKSFTDFELDGTEEHVYRCAALLHDVGHYPYSHALEGALKRRYSPDLTSAIKTTGKYLKHEAVGAKLLEHDSALRRIFDEAALSSDAVRRVFSKKDPTRLIGLISSDLDADRLDYLPRTAHATGLPYGRIDQDYIVREVRVDNQNRLCWSQRALGAVDHFLISRYYDYSQIVHNKTVVGLEEMLKDVVYALTDPNLQDGLRLDLDDEGVEKLIKSDMWYQFDDHTLFEKIKKSAFEKTKDDGFKEKCLALVSRRPPRRVCEIGHFSSSKFRPIFERFKQNIKGIIPEFASKFNISESLWWFWSKEQSLTSYEESSEPTESDEGTVELVRLYDDKTGGSRLSVLDPASLLGQVFLRWHFLARVYVLIERDDPRRAQINAFVNKRVREYWDEAVAELDELRLPLSITA